MMRARMLVVAIPFVAWHAADAQRTQPAVDRADSARMAVFRDTGRSVLASAEGRGYDLRRRAQRDSLRAALGKERTLWRGKRPSAYRFLLRVSCFCPGQRGWLLIEARKGQPARAWDKTGRPVPLTDWNTFTIDELFDNLLRSTDRDALVQIAFERRWHLPSYVRTSVLPGPDRWSIVEVRGFRPL
jgi:hypothetical protein